MANVEDAIVARLASGGAVSALVAGRIYKEQAPQQGAAASFPRLVYRVTADDELGTMDGANSAPVAEMDIECQTFGGSAAALATAVRNRLRDWQDRTAASPLIHHVQIGAVRDDDEPPEAAGEVPIRKRIVPITVRYYR